MQVQAPHRDLVLEVTSRRGEHRRSDFDAVHNAARSVLVEKQGWPRTATEADLGHGATLPNLHGLDSGEDDGSVARV
ncbi:hypothetical protein M6B22_00860 [Jatrophihabitans cynanchi]|uniref:Uncharacterized protein n=1 Tax=Jatrophihabitans cynanchi TaxID=2944128 RepID=A0ABY7K178_9ACTN|nr:hypothetical protein [Jatrophihabitans sp. SB3-54]WAX57332.1 hypothetical protein M6B22_00860 [Jatrophihabitans sp. SB3-54]